MSKDDKSQVALSDRIDAIEEAYEFMLAYAAQGRKGDEDSGPGSSVRDFLEGADKALKGLAAAFAGHVSTEDGKSADSYRAFLEVLDQDARNAQAAFRVVLAQPKISSQLVDNLNALIHLRALLTDIFLIDEILKAHGTA